MAVQGITWSAGKGPTLGAVPRLELTGRNFLELFGLKSDIKPHHRHQ